MASHAQLSVQERLDEDKQIAAGEALARTLQGQLLDATGYPAAVSEWTTVDEPARHGLKSPWRRMVRSMFRIRRLQRYFGHIGSFLKTYSSEFRDSLKDDMPKK